MIIIHLLFFSVFFAYLFLIFPFLFPSVFFFFSDSFSTSENCHLPKKKFCFSKYCSNFLKNIYNQLEAVQTHEIDFIFRYLWTFLHCVSAAIKKDWSHRKMMVILLWSRGILGIAVKSLAAYVQTLNYPKIEKKKLLFIMKSWKSLSSVNAES